MGKRKKVNNVVKVDVTDYAFPKGEILPVLVQHASRDGRRFEQVLHQVPTPRQLQTPPTFNPSPAFNAAGAHASFVGAEPADEPVDSERVSSRSLPMGCIITCISSSKTLCARGVETVIRLC